MRSRLPFARSIVASLLFAGLSIVLTACAKSGAVLPTATYSPQAKTASGLVAEGDERLAASDFSGAERAYQKAIDTDPKFAPAYSHLAFAHLFNPETRRGAIAEAQKATALDPNSAEAFAYLARAYDWNAKFDEARQAGEKAVSLDPGSANAQSFLGEIYTDLRMYDEAKKTAEKAVQLDPKNAEAHRNLGYLYNDMTRYEDALAEWQAAYDLQPKFVHRLTSIAVYYLYLRPDSEKARQWLNDALALAPDDSIALIFLARLDSSEGKADAAMAGCKHLLEVAPTSPDGHNCEATVFADQGDYAAAEAARQAAIAADPNDEGSYIGLGYVYLAKGECGKAADQFQKAVDLFPRSGRDWAALGRGQSCNGDADAAIKSTKKAVELEPYNGDNHIGLGRLYLAQGKFRDAESEMKKAAEIDPKNDQYLIWLGRVYAAQGDAGKALEQYQKAVALNPNDGDNSTVLAFAQLQNRDFAKATDNFKQALDLYKRGASPASIAQAQYGLGVSYVAQNLCADAIPALQEALRLNPNLSDARQYLSACLRSAGLVKRPLPSDVTESSPLGEAGALLLLNQTLPALGVQGQAGYKTVSGQPVLLVLYAANAKPNDPAFAAEQSPVVYAGSWALARLVSPVENLLVVAVDANGQQISSVLVRREYALWWTQHLIDDDGFASLWKVTNQQ